MKKALTILLLLAGTIGFSQEFYSFGEVAYFPNIIEMYDIPEGNHFGTSLGVGFEFKGFYLEAEQVVKMTFVETTERINFQPYSEKYYVRGGFTIWALGIEYEHVCFHDVEWSGAYGGHDKISINFDSRRLTNERK